MRKLLNKLRDRKGISMTEVVVAMAVVVIVTGAAISLLVASVRFDAKYNSQTVALNACESAVHCLRFTDDADKLKGYLTRLGFEEVEGVYTLPNSGTVKVENIEGVWTVTFDGDVIYEKNRS